MTNKNTEYEVNNKNHKKNKKKQKKTRDMNKGVIFIVRFHDRVIIQNLINEVKTMWQPNLV